MVLIPQKSDSDFCVPEAWWWVKLTEYHYPLSTRVFGERMLAIRAHRLKAEAAARRAWAPIVTWVEDF